MENPQIIVSMFQRGVPDVDITVLVDLVRAAFNFYNADTRRRKNIDGMYVCMYWYVCMYVCMHVCMYACMYVYVCVRM